VNQEAQEDEYGKEKKGLEFSKQGIVTQKES
jgi:hypothetical protein